MCVAERDADGAQYRSDPVSGEGDGAEAAAWAALF